ncbi:MAG TPA: MFS transporter [Steroidobacteraceae bacterium]
MNTPSATTVPVSRFLPLAMASALFMDLLDTAALGSALPTLAREFHTEPLHLKLALTAYLMTMAILVPASGWLADRYGARRVFINAMRVYLLGSLCCGLSNSMGQLVAARVLQGIGGAMMTPVARLIVVASTPRERLVQAMNAFTIPAIVGPLMGPPLAGLLLEVANWRWIFFINIPVGLLGIAAVLRIVPRLRHTHPGPFDGFGFAAAAVGIVTLIVLSESVGSDLLSFNGRMVVAAAAIAAWIVFIHHALSAPCPMLDLRLLAKPTYRASMIGGSLLRLGIGATPFLLPLLLQVGLGWSPIKAGAVIAIMTIGSLLARFGGTHAIRVFGFRTALIITAGLTALFTAAPAVFNTRTSLVLVLASLLAVGFFRAAHYVASTAIAFAEVSPEEVSRASTLSTVIQQISLSCGISFAGVTLYMSAGTSSHFTAAQFLLPFVSLGVVTLLAVPVYTRLDRQAGAHMRSGAKVSS